MPLAQPKLSSDTLSPPESCAWQMGRMLYERYPNYGRLWIKGLEEKGEAFNQQFSAHVAAVFGAKPSPRWEEAIEGYAEFCTDALRAQVQFEKTGRYPASSYDEVCAACYLDADYMQRRYLPGQYLSHFVWPHHHALQTSFREQVLGRIRNEVTAFCEVGVGCGAYSVMTLAELPQVVGTGYDISAHAVEFTVNAVRLNGFANRYKAVVGDFFTLAQGRQYDFLINQEVLEHLPDPQSFVRQLREHVRAGGWAYITAAVNAAHVDHIYLYRSPQEVEDHLLAGGWNVEARFIESNEGGRRNGPVPTIAAYLLRNP